MSYVEEHLLPGETVVYRAALHWVAFVTRALLIVVLLVLAAFAFWWDLPVVGGVLIALSLVPLAWAYITQTSSEFAVTNKRVVIKVGWIQRNTLELLLSKVEAIGVDQGVLGRLMGFGTITVTGTGGTDEQFRMIAKPLEFRRQVQAQVTQGEAEWRTLAAMGTGGPGAHAGAPREERECPFCAERILARARVCKHCGREVEPVAG